MILNNCVFMDFVFRNKNVNFQTWIRMFVFEFLHGIAFNWPIEMTCWRFTDWLSSYKVYININLYQNVDKKSRWWFSSVFMNLFQWVLSEINVFNFQTFIMCLFHKLLILYKNVEIKMNVMLFQRFVWCCFMDFIFRKSMKVLISKLFCACFTSYNIILHKKTSKI